MDTKIQIIEPFNVGLTYEGAPNVLNLTTTIDPIHLVVSYQVEFDLELQDINHL
jgi:hypothetical protein